MKYVVLTPVWIETTRLPGLISASRSLSSSETAIVSAALATASRSHARSLRHSISNSARFHAVVSRFARRCQIRYSTLCSNRTTGMSPPSGTLAAAKRKSLTQRSTWPCDTIAFTEGATCAEHHVVVQTVWPNPLLAPQWAPSSPASATVVPRLGHMLDLDGGFDHVWRKRFKGSARTGARKWASKSWLRTSMSVDRG